MSVKGKSDIYNSVEGVQENVKKSDEDPSLHYTLKFYKDIKLDIFKPLLPLKISLFLWFGMGAVVQQFLSVYLKQRGITLSELSLIYIITPAVQLLGSVTSGVVADKIGRSKPILVANMLMAITFLVGLRLIPSLSEVDCDDLPVSLRCHHLHFSRLTAEARCGIHKDSFDVSSCEVNCPENVTRCFVAHNLMCQVLNRREDFRNFSLSLQVNSSYVTNGECFYNLDSLTHTNLTYSWCDVPHKMYCTISCSLLSDTKCSLHKEYRSRIFITIGVVMVLFLITFSNAYRFLDVTAMCLVKKYNKDFGRQRVWSIMGIVVCTPVAGFIISATTADGEPSNYAAFVYLTIALALVTLGSVGWLEVHINAPGTRMWKKSMTLLKKPDFLCFLVILFILGATWGFSKIFLSLYLVELNAPSVLIGLVPSIASIYGLPILYTSNWWIKRIGTTNIFILALLSYVVNTVGYSFLQDPWWSLALEATNVLAYHLLWVAVITYSHAIAPEGLTATVISSAGGIHFGIGKGSGSLIGGLSMEAYGARTAFRIMAVLCLCTAAQFAAYTYARKWCARRSRRTSVQGNEMNLQASPIKTKTYL